MAPLLELVDEFERYAIALVDKEKARLFTFFASEIEEMESFKDFVFGKSDQGGVSQARYQQHHEAHVYWHLKRVAQHMTGPAGRATLGVEPTLAALWADLFHRAVVRAVERSGGVEVMHGAAARRLVELGDGLGALLRYPSTVPRLAT